MPDQYLDPLEWPTGDPIPEGEPSVNSLWPSIAGRAAEFRANYAAWMAGGADDLSSVGVELRTARTVAGTAQAEALAAGDSAGVTALAAVVADLDAAIAARDEAATQADAYGGTWDVLASVFAAASAVGLGAGPMIPVALTVSVAVAGIAALAYVVTTWQTLRAKANQLSTWTADVIAGRLTSAQVVELAKAGSLDSSGGFLSGLFGGAGVGVLLAALAAVWLLGRGK